MCAKQIHMQIVLTRLDGIQAALVSNCDEIGTSLHAVQRRLSVEVESRTSLETMRRNSWGHSWQVCAAISTWSSCPCFRHRHRRQALKGKAAPFQRRCEQL
eukprot:s2742_g7.t1